jgi:hypothetical protein
MGLWGLEIPYRRHARLVVVPEEADLIIILVLLLQWSGMKLELVMI